ncbi:hypothetical protein Tco_1177059 [Tanacetum coccineum]
MLQLFTQVNKVRVIMSSATFAVTLHSPASRLCARQSFWGPMMKEVSRKAFHGHRIGYDRRPYTSSPTLTRLHTRPRDHRHRHIPQDEDEHEFSAEEQPLPHVDSPTAESPVTVPRSTREGLTERSNEDDEDRGWSGYYPMTVGDNGNDEDGDSSRETLMVSMRMRRMRMKRRRRDALNSGSTLLPLI